MPTAPDLGGFDKGERRANGLAPMEQPHAASLLEIANAEAHRLHEAVREWGPEPASSRVLSELERSLAGGPKEGPYAPPTGRGRLLTLGSGLAVVAVEHEPAPEGGGEAPVAVVVGSVGSAADGPSASTLAAEVLDALGGEGLREVKVFLPGGVEAGGDGWPRVRAGKRLFAMPVSVVREGSRPPGAERLRAERATDLSFYEVYAEHYERWNRESPELARHVRPETREALERHMAEGLLFLVRIDGELGGVVACFGGWCERGVRGYRMAEEFLYPAFRGRGLAAALQRACIDELDGSAGEVVFGWIHPLNVPSMRTARRVGRIDVGGYWYLRPRD